MAKIGQLVRYMTPEGKETLASIVALSKDCKSQVVEACPTCGAHAAIRREVPTHEGIEDKTTVELVELELAQTKDERGQPVITRQIVGGRQAVPMAADLKTFLATPNTWLPSDEEA